MTTTPPHPILKRIITRNPPKQNPIRAPRKAVSKDPLTINPDLNSKQR